MEKKFFCDLGESVKVKKFMAQGRLKAANGQSPHFIVFDTETSGLDCRTCRIIQISGIKCELDADGDFCETDRLNLYINPEFPIEKRITELTGITNLKLTSEPTEKEQWEKIHSFFGDGFVGVGHNVSFDIGFLNAMYRRQSGKDPKIYTLDTLSMSRELHRKEEAGSHKLGAMAHLFGLDTDLTFHNSMDDVTATMRLFRHYLEEYGEKPGNSGKRKVKVLSCFPYEGFRGMKRLYANLDWESRRVYFEQTRSCAWGEGKDSAGTIDSVDMLDVQRQVLEMYGLEKIEDLRLVNEKRWAAS